tara:strand:- start:492 stop:674 length:183 start_codon:yes stop_codon:yes gene_type:complete
MDVQHMLDNAATASQHKPIIDEPVVTGAILRSIHQWIASKEDGDIDFLKFELTNHPHFKS